MVKKSQIQELFRAKYHYIPKEELREVFLIGDFNIDLEKDSNEKDLLCALAKEMGLSISKAEDRTRSCATLDYVIANRDLKVLVRTEVTGLSDHKALIVEVIVPKRKKHPDYRVINKKLAVTASEWALANSNNSYEFLDLINRFRKRNKNRIITVLNRRQVERKLFLTLVKEHQEDTKIILNRYWEKLIEDNENMRNSINSKNTTTSEKLLFFQR